MWMRINRACKKTWFHFRGSSYWILLFTSERAARRPESPRVDDDGVRWFQA